jgi:formate--tetrahydrofolate ligase
MNENDPMNDITIARAATLSPILDIAAKAGIPQDALVPYGWNKAKVSLPFIDSLKDKPDGKLILVTAISPTPAGEGKTTTTIGLGDALNHIGKRAMIALREPSLGPCFGTKGGATGGGYAQVVPMEEINLHFTGDFHAITSAHNLLAAMIDNHIHWGNALDIDPRRVTWRRVIDMNDRALRQTVTSLGGVSNGFPRESGFDITVASEVMAILCLSSSLDELETRLGDIVVAQTRAKAPVTARDLKASGAMAVLLKDALMPNLVQTLEHAPVLIHGGPFANIAHGCNSVLATRTALKLADYVVTEAGFGADLGAEKFFNIKCRKAGLAPSAVVLVATVRALKMHGGVSKADLNVPDAPAVTRGAANLARHLSNTAKFGVPVVVAINRFSTDTDEEIAAVRDATRALGAEVFVCTHHGEGGKGAAELAHFVADLADKGSANFAPLYPDTMPLRDKVLTIAQQIYGAADIACSSAIEAKFKALQATHGSLPVCMAKTQYSFSTDPTLRGAPSGHIVEISELRLSAGAGFVVVLAGDIMTMPGLPRIPAAEHIGLNDAGEIVGLS